MRLIDADVLEKYLDDCAFCKNCPNKNKGYRYCTLDCKFPDYCDNDWQRVIDEQPTIDGLEVGLEKTTRAIIQLQDIINDNLCISCRFRLDTLMKELKGIKAIIENKMEV